MKKKYQNAFFIFGLAVLAIMVTQLDFAQVWDGLQRAGYWFAAVVALWLFLYMFNTTAWYIIIASTASKHRGERLRRPCEVGFWWLYKVTVSGFALNYATPGGLMGGEPYRIMALAPRIGTERASSSVILYVMTHIFSHLLFWLMSVFIWLLTQPADALTASVMAATTVFCTLGLWFFISCYRTGLASRLINLTRHMPMLKKRMEAFSLHILSSRKI